jgi:thiol-disulfide isomerase/thioredoxin
VLVDFWASWCQPCRIDNPNVVKAYNEFKDKNFTILGVSLDQNKDAWLKAIQKDGLTWTHVSDLKFWDNAAAVLYGVQSIPYNVLVDPNGNIVAENLHGEEISNTLRKVLK